MNEQIKQELRYKTILSPFSLMFFLFFMRLATASSVQNCLEHMKRKRGMVKKRKWIGRNLEMKSVK